MTLHSAPRIRRARPDELPTVLAIDDDATRFYATIGFPIQLASTDPFTVAEQARWSRALSCGRVLLAEGEDPSEGEAAAPNGVAVMDVLDGEPYLDQLAVRVAAMRRGFGTALLEAAATWAADEGATRLWLTTYGHLAHNRPFYERRGFSVVEESRCPPGVRLHLDAQRHSLPAPEHRIAMCRTLAPQPAGVDERS